MAKNSEKTQAEIYREERKARLAKAAAKKQKRANRVSMTKGTKTAIAIVVVIALVAGIAGFAISKSGIKYRKAAALSIGDVGNISAAEYSFYYRTIANNYFEYGYYYDSQYGTGYGAMFMGGYDYTKSPDEQEYGEELEGYENPTWADFFDYTVRTELTKIKAFNKLAAEKGITLDEDEIASIDEQIASVKEQADSNNYSLGAYLKASYGDGINKSLFRTILEEQQIATKYQNTVTDELIDELSDKEIEAEYKEDTTAYDKVGVAYYLVKAETKTTTDDDGNESSAVTKATMKAAKKKAEALAESKTVKALSKAVDKLAGAEDSLYQADAMSNETLTNSISSDAAEWAYGKNIKDGDTKIFEVEDSGYYVCMITKAPYREDRSTIDVRHILIGFTSEDSSSDSSSSDDTTSDSTSTEAEEKTDDKDIPALDSFKDAPVNMSVTADTAKDKEAYEKAELILREYLNGDRTAESFGALAIENSEDTGSQEAGGLYEDVAPGTMITEFNDWCFDSSRKAGDVGIVETSYGYHIMYFVETNEDSEWKASIKAHLGEHAFEHFTEENITDEKYPLTVANQSYIDEAVSSTNKAIKRQIQNLSSASSVY